jgi:hypothetical protein
MFCPSAHRAVTVTSSRLSTRVSAATGFHVQCIMWMHVYNVCELTTYNVPRVWQNVFTELWTEIFSVNADLLFLGEYLNFLSSEVLICHNGRPWFDSRFCYPFCVNWVWDSPNLLWNHYQMMFSAADLPHTLTTVVAFCLVSVMKMI